MNGSPPPPIPHKVWILDCKSCGMFLTNRGMKAVLLLRPNVPLYSTDALPINCSAFSPPGSGSSEPGLPAPERPPSRTCECLTQTLCCHGCGNAVGYMIVSPCVRCTSSITVNNRATNGHRFVFYSSEITAAERLYVPGESGVHPFHPPPPVPPSVQNVQAALANMYIVNSTSTSSTPPRTTVAQQGYYSPASPTSNAPGAALASPISPGNLSPSALAARSRAASSVQTPPPPRQSRTSDDTSRAAAAVPPVPPNSHSTSPHPLSTPTFADPSSPPPPLGPGPGPAGNPVSASASSASRTPARARAASTSAALGLRAYTPAQLVRVHPQQQQQQQQQQQRAEPVKPGEVLFWHHLLRSGEIAAVAEDARARRGARREGEGDGGDAKTAVPRRTGPRGFVAGR
ncbi:hypothetical protein BD413DRAFT_605207 [Trametes elegans]|nr:hypothetical protein BD413DRAFT_605207 [Trametes elegans]